MTGGTQYRYDVRSDGHPAVVVDGLELSHGRMGISHGVDGSQQRLVLSGQLAVFALHLRLLDIGAVSQHDLAEVFGRRSGVDGAAEAFLEQFGKQTAVVDMGVCKHDRVDIGRVKGKLPVVSLLQSLAALIQAAVDENPLVCHCNQKCRSGDRLCGTAELQTHG